MPGGDAGRAGNGAGLPGGERCLVPAPAQGRWCIHCVQHFFCKMGLWSPAIQCCSEGGVV